MKKIITWLLMFVICFLCAFSCITVEASIKSEFLTSDKIKFRSTQSKLISKTVTGNYETDGFTHKIDLNGRINSGEAFYIKIDESVFDLNPTKIVYCLQCDANYSSKTAKFYFSNANNNECPDESDTVVGYGDSNGIGVSIDTTTTEFSIDLTSDKYKNVLNNRLNYFYMFNENRQNPVSNLTLISVKVYYNSSEAEYSVNIDNELIKNVNVSENFVLPKSDLSGFVAYKYKDDYYDEGDVINNIEENINITSLSVGKLTMQKGASARIGSVSGIRFFTTIDQNKICDLINNGAIVEKGTLIAPSDIIGNSDFTTGIGKENVDYIKVKSLIGTAFYSENTLAGSIVNIKDKNITRDFIGRGYVNVKIGKIEKTYYADYYDNDIKNNTRSINYIAKNYRISNNEEYLSLSEKQKFLIDNWADRNN